MQRKSGIYRGRFYYKGETYTKDNADLKKLVQEMEDLRYEVKHGLKGKGDNITLDTWFDIWLNTHKKRTIKESTRVRYDDFYTRYMKKQIGKQRVSDFNPIILERLLQKMADDDYSTKTIRDVYNILNAMFKYALHNRILTFNPCAGVEVPKTKTKPIRVLTVEEQREVLEHAKGRIHENLIQVALGTGMRGGEMLGLTWDDVDFRKREISVNKTLVHIKDKETKKYVFKYQTPKTKNSIRTIPMQDSVYRALKRQRIQLKEMQLSASEWQPLEGFENLVFVGKNGKPITEHTFQVTLDWIEKSINKIDDFLKSGKFNSINPIKLKQLLLIDEFLVRGYKGVYSNTSMNYAKCKSLVVLNNNDLKIFNGINDLTIFNSKFEYLRKTIFRC